MAASSSGTLGNSVTFLISNRQLTDELVLKNARAQEKVMRRNVRGGEGGEGGVVLLYGVVCRQILKFVSTTFLSSINHARTCLPVICGDFHTNHSSAQKCAEARVFICLTEPKVIVC